MNLKQLAHVHIKDADRGEIEAVFATLDVVDHDGDVTRKGAFDTGAPVRISAWGHSVWSDRGNKMPVGKGTIRETGTEAILDGKFFLDTTEGRDTFTVVKEMSVDGPGQEWSYGFDIIDSEPTEVDGKKARLLTKLKVHEISPVLLGAGIGTRTVGVKDTERPKLSEEGDAAVAAVAQFLDRCEEVVTFRTANGKSRISDTSVDVLGRLDAELKRLDALMREAPPESNDDLEREFARFVALTQGVTL